MELSKKQKILLTLGAIALVLIVFTKKIMGTIDLAKSFDNLKNRFSLETLKVTEKIFRLETAHFKSGGFLKTNGAGMEAVRPSYPYGWTSLKPFWDANSQYKPTGTIELRENKQAAVKGSGIVKKFIVFPTPEAGIASVAQRVKILGNTGGGYFSKVKSEQIRYEIMLSKIDTHYV